MVENTKTGIFVASCRFSRCDESWSMKRKSSYGQWHD